MDLNSIIDQLETGDQDVALVALQIYNKEVNITVYVGLLSRKSAFASYLIAAELLSTRNMPNAYFTTIIFQCRGYLMLSGPIYSEPFKV